MTLTTKQRHILAGGALGGNRASRYALEYVQSSGTVPFLSGQAMHHQGTPAQISGASAFLSGRPIHYSGTEVSLANRPRGGFGLAGPTGDRASRYAAEYVRTQRGVRGLEGVGDPDVRNQISRWADAASAGDRAAFESAKHAMASADPWGASGPNWYTSVSNGGWYAYDQVTTMMSTTIPERHPGWLTAVGTVVGTVADISTAGLISQEQKNAATDAVVQTGGGVGQQAGDVLSTGATAVDKFKDFLASYGKVILGILGGGVVLTAAVVAYSHGRGTRRPNAPRKRN